MNEIEDTTPHIKERAQVANHAAALARAIDQRIIDTEQCAQNTDTEIWRRVPDDFYSPSIHVTAEGAIGIDVGGYVIVRSVEEWHKAMKAQLTPDPWPLKR